MEYAEKMASKGAAKSVILEALENATKNIPPDVFGSQHIQRVHAVIQTANAAYQQSGSLGHDMQAPG